MIFNKKPWSHDARSRRFSHKVLFGVAAKLPTTLERPRTISENQLNTTRCAAYAGAKIGQYIHGVRMSPEWQTKKISELEGLLIDNGGSDPNAAMKSQCYQWNGGYLPYDASPLTLEKDGLPSGDPKNWQPALDVAARDYSDEGFVKPDGGTDIFDSVCNALYMAYDSKTQRGAGVQAFSGWYDSFNTSYITTIDDSVPSFGAIRQQHTSWLKAIFIFFKGRLFGSLKGYHSYPFSDFERVGSPNDVLILENSYGGEPQRMTRSVVNALFAKYGTSVKIVKPLTAEQLKLARQENIYGKIQRTILQIWMNLVIYLISIGK